LKGDNDLPEMKDPTTEQILTGIVVECVDSNTASEATEARKRKAEARFEGYAKSIANFINGNAEIAAMTKNKVKESLGINTGSQDGLIHWLLTHAYKLEDETGELVYRDKEYKILPTVKDNAFEGVTPPEEDVPDDDFFKEA